MGGAPPEAIDVAGPVQAEVFVLCLAAGVPVVTGPCGPEAWYLEVAADEDPMAVVSAAIRRVLGDPVVVHSTSWRRDRAAVILSFVAVVDASLVGSLPTASVSRADLARGQATAPPAAIASAQVIEHGLRHLAWLAKTTRWSLTAWAPTGTACSPAIHPNQFGICEGTCRRIASTASVA